MNDEELNELEELLNHEIREFLIILTRNEVLYLDDSLTLMIEREVSNHDGTQLSTMRAVLPTAALPVPLELVDKIAMGVLYTTDPDNLGMDVELKFDSSELYLLREITQSFIKIGNEPVGFNLKKKIYGALYSEEYKTNKLADTLTKDIVLTSNDPPLVNLARPLYDAPNDAETKRSHEE
ncbi:uncharacterized protein METZ01_LOCUS461465 [marine metagenome]|uniref:Uncharacterized protein n=1 Tax=marine metagenome TaxID=408172 RepID=A0A383AM18_9ZZZZ